MRPQLKVMASDRGDRESVQLSLILDKSLNEWPYGICDKHGTFGVWMTISHYGVSGQIAFY
jgi:hypothetical protein